MDSRDFWVGKLTCTLSTRSLTHQRITSQRSELAPAVARAFNKLKTLRENARSWLLKYPEHALTGLLPAALGKAGEAQDNARAALRMLTENGHQPLLQEIARRYNQPEVTDAVNALLALDPLDNHPTKSPLFRPFISHRSGRARY